MESKHDQAVCERVNANNQPAPPTPALIEVADVTKAHHCGSTEVHALRGVTCHLEAGSFHFFVGPSGSGKSTLLYLIGALDRPTTGDIRVAGESLADMSTARRDLFRREQVGFVFQSFNLLRNLNAVDNVLIPYMPKGVSTERRSEARQMLERIGLGSRLDHFPNQLSGGEQQRVAIARALLKRPQIVLADEPTGELDTTNGAQVMGLLREMSREQNTTVVVVTHDRQYLHPGDRLLEIRDGKLVRRETIQ